MNAVALWLNIVLVTGLVAMLAAQAAILAVRVESETLTTTSR